MKQRGKHIIDEFELLRSVAGKSGLELPPEIIRSPEIFRKRDLLFKKVKLDAENAHHAAFLCAIIYDHLYSNERSVAKTLYGDDKDCALLERFVRYSNQKKSSNSSGLYRAFFEADSSTKAEYKKAPSNDALRMRIKRAAQRAVAGELKLTTKRQARLDEIMPELRRIFDR
ncbi:hypothetical protein AB7714_19915 [Tardiphaga sp. 1201_B9_N1_1]|uniref:hypothetical protein n=1 Tax=unclassified Tardiphaga TaxID=2631404 RepID=UPI003F23FC5D